MNTSRAPQQDDCYGYATLIVCERKDDPIMPTRPNVRERPNLRRQEVHRFRTNSTAGDQPPHQGLSEGVAVRRTRSGVLRCHGDGQDDYDGQVIEEHSVPPYLAPNKTAGSALYGEFKGFFPNSVEYFVSYYDYYQTRRPCRRSDTLLEKESQNQRKIDRMRHSAHRALWKRDDR